MSNQDGSIMTLKNSKYKANQDIKLTAQNTQEDQRNINQQVNTESSPALYSKDQMLINNQTTPAQNQVQQNQNINKNILLILQNSPLLLSPGIPSQIDIINAKNNGDPLHWLVKVYKPFETTCPACTNNVMTVPETSWNCCACFCITYGDIFCLGLFSLIRCCTGSACCCYDAIHKCPKCGFILAKRNAMYQ